MLVGYVSDERDVALADVLLEFERDGETIALVRSSPRGGVNAEIPEGPCRVTLVKDGFGSKSVQIEARPEAPQRFRLLSDGLMGYAWPKWVKSGEPAEFRVHSVEPYRLSLWRYGWRREPVRLLGWFDEHGPRAVMQITPDGDYTQTGVRWNQVGYGSLHHTQLVTAPERSGLYYFHAKGESGAFFSFTTRPFPSTARSPSTTSPRTWRSPIPSPAGQPATWRPPSGGSWAGSSARATPTISTLTISSTPASSTSISTRC